MKQKPYKAKTRNMTLSGKPRTSPKGEAANMSDVIARCRGGEAWAVLKLIDMMFDNGWMPYLAEGGEKRYGAVFYNRFATQRRGVSEADTLYEAVAAAAENAKK